MDYTSILKRAWTVTWRFKILWLFGLFAGAGTGGGGGNGGGTNTRSGAPFGNDTAAVTRFLEQNAAILILAGLAILVLGLVWFVVGVAARGGLIHLVNEAEEGREVRAGDGWSVGFHKWGRVFGVQFLAGLPLLIMALVVGVAAAVALVGVFSSGQPLDSATSAVAGMFVSGCCFLVVFGMIAIVLGVVLGIVAELALRYAVLEDRFVIESLKLGWRDLRSKRGAFLMFAIMFGVGIAYGILVAVVAVALMLPGILAIMAGGVAVGGLMVLVAALILALPAAIYSTFYHAAWTIFFRKMTGRDLTDQTVAAPVAPVGYASPYPPAPGAPAQPAPYQAWSPETPPVVPAPMPPMPEPPMAPVPEVSPELPVMTPPETAPPAPPMPEPPAPTDG